MKKLFTPITALLVALVAAFAVLSPVPALAADEVPVDPNPQLTACERQVDSWQSEAAYWKASSLTYQELHESATDGLNRASDIARFWQRRAVVQVGQIDRLRSQRDRLAIEKRRLNSKVRALRAKIRALR